MDERTRRVGLNEALFREVNEEIESLGRLTALADNSLDIVCECGDLLCAERIAVLTDAYEHVRADPTLFFVLRGHDIPAVEDVVESTKYYDVVQKRQGGAAELANATDPRS